MHTFFYIGIIYKGRDLRVPIQYLRSLILVDLGWICWFVGPNNHSSFTTNVYEWICKIIFVCGWICTHKFDDLCVMMISNLNGSSKCLKNFNCYKNIV